ncbi:MAG TPA: NTF2 fold immunity protein, partial [Bacillota bacterium]|nr:NTF2 fold immunity protein [Bacillota bacterium]
ANRGSIVGVIDLYGGDITEKVDANDPAALIIHGNRDQLMPYEGSIALANKLKQAGVYHEFFTMESEGHSYRNRYYPEILVQITRFLDRVLNPNVPRQGYVPDAKAAIEIAERVLVTKYGSEDVISHRPFKAQLTQDNQVWRIEGSLSNKTAKGLVLGGVPFVELRKADGEVLTVSHSK